MSDDQKPVSPASDEELNSLFRKMEARLAAMEAAEAKVIATIEPELLRARLATLEHIVTATICEIPDYADTPHDVATAVKTWVARAKKAEADLAKVVAAFEQIRRACCVARADGNGCSGAKACPGWLAANALDALRRIRNG